MKAGVNDFMIKPVDPGELQVRVRAGERVLRLERELDERNAALDRINVELLSRVYETMKRDVSMAAIVQKSLLPKPRVLRGFTFQSLYLPSNLLSGDMFGYFPLDEAHIAFFQMDVSGHGISSELISFAFSKRLWQERHSECLASTSLVNEHALPIFCIPSRSSPISIGNFPTNPKRSHIS
ncbi:hypothetical protein CCP3SC1_40010 [Gammaproteobacteria bacterium]